jgi:hypothetical protein
MAYSESQPPPPPLPRTELSPGLAGPLTDYIAEPWAHDARGYLQTYLQITPHYPLATLEEYKYTLCGMKKRHRKTYYDNVLKEANTTLRFSSFKNVDGVQNLVATMPDVTGVLNPNNRFNIY